MAWDDLVADTVTIELNTFGQSCTYERPGSTNFDAVNPFTLTAAISTGGEYTNPTAPLFGEAFVRLSDIPCLPQKGDLITPSDPKFLGRTFRVNKMLLDVSQNHGKLQIRWPGTTNS